MYTYIYFWTFNHIWKTWTELFCGLQEREDFLGKEASHFAYDHISAPFISQWRREKLRQQLLHIDALLPRTFHGNMNYSPKSEDEVRGLRPAIYVTLKSPLGNSDIPMVVIIDFLQIFFMREHFLYKIVQKLKRLIKWQQVFRQNSL